MALSYLLGAKGPVNSTHDVSNVNPFHDPANSQFGVIANSAVDLASPQAVQTAQPPNRLGTAEELRSRRYSLRGSYARAASEPPAETGARADMPTGHEGSEPTVPRASAPPLPDAERNPFANETAKDLICLY